MKPYFIVLLHLTNATLSTFVSGILLYGFVTRFRLAVTAARPVASFELSSYAWAFVLVGLVAGYFSFSHWGGKSAFWVWLAPAAVLLIRIASFPAESVFSSGPADGWNYFFGKIACSAVNWQSLAHVAPRCLTRTLYLGPVYSALAYAAGALVKRWEVFEPNRPQHA